MADHEGAYIPEFIVKLDGQDVSSNDGLIVEALVSQDHMGPDFARIVLNNNEGNWSDDRDVGAGKSVEVSLGVSGEGAQQIFKGEVVGVELKFHEAKASQYTIRAFDKMHRMTRTPKTRTCMDAKDSDVASEIAGEYGLGTDVEDSKFINKYLMQHNETDLKFLQQRAWRIGWVLDCVEDKLLFKKPDLDASPTVTLKWEENIRNVKFASSTGFQRGEQEIRGWNPGDKKEYVGTASSGQEWSKMGGSKSGPEDAGAHGDSTDRHVQHTVDSQEEADMLAEGGLNRHAMNYMALKVEASGDQRIRIHKTLKLESVGERYDGNYYVTQVRHQLRSGHGMGGGYTTFVQLIRTGGGS